MGFSISFARPGMFAWSVRNCTKIVLTDRRIRGLRQSIGLLRLLRGRGGEPVFDVALTDIVSIERVDFAANKGLWIRYRSGAESKEVSITASALCHPQLFEIERLLRAATSLSPSPP